MRILGTQVRGRVRRMAGTPVDDLLGVFHRAGGLVLDNRPGIGRVLRGRIECEAADGILDPQQVLKLKRHLGGRPDQEQVVRDELRLDVARRNPLAPVPVAHLLAVLVVKHLQQVTYQRATVFDQGLERVFDLLRSFFMEHDAPADLLDVVEARAEWRGKRGRAVAVNRVVRIQSGAGQHGLRQICDRGRRYCILTRLRIDTIEVKELRARLGRCRHRHALGWVHHSYLPLGLTGRASIRRGPPPFIFGLSPWEPPPSHGIGRLAGCLLRSAMPIFVDMRPGFKWQQAQNSMNFGDIRSAAQLIPIERPGNPRKGRHPFHERNRWRILTPSFLVTDAARGTCGPSVRSAFWFAEWR